MLEMIKNRFTNAEGEFSFVKTAALVGGVVAGAMLLPGLLPVGGLLGGLIGAAGGMALGEMGSSMLEGNRGSGQQQTPPTSGFHAEERPQGHGHGQHHDIESPAPTPGSAPNEGRTP